MPISSSSSLVVRAARAADLPAVGAIMEPFIARGDLLARSLEELTDLLPHAFVAESEDQIVGFAAMEIYSRKLAEIQGLCFDGDTVGPETVGKVLQPCLQRAREHGVLEVMAVVPAELEDVLKSQGFDFCLPNHKRAMFIRPAQAGATTVEAPVGVTFRAALPLDLGRIIKFLDPFVARGEVLPRSWGEMSELSRHAFLAEVDDQVVGFVVLEIYSGKLSELQCLAVDRAVRNRGIGRRLVELCVQRAREFGIAETMAISLRDEFFLDCGFGYCLAGPKTALFLRP